MALKLNNPFTSDYNALLSEWRAYNANNPNKTMTFQDYSMMKKAGGINTTIGTTTPTVNIPSAPNLGTSSKSNNNVTNNNVTNNNVIPQTDSELALESAYAKDMENIANTRKFLVGNAISNTLLNMTNLSQAFKQRPNAIGVQNIPNIEYPNLTSPMLADLSSSVGKYRSGVARMAGEKGLSPAERINAEANILDTELAQKAKIAELQNAQNVTQANANSDIASKNIENQYAAKIKDAARMDEINANRSALFTQGLTNLGKIGTSLGQNLLTSQQQEANLGSMNAYMKMWQDAVAKNETQLDFETYLKQLLGQSGGTSNIVSSNIPLTTKELE